MLNYINKLNMRTHRLYRNKARKLLQLKGIQSTDVCEYVYGCKTKKSRLSQKKTGKTTLFFEESSKIIEYYGVLAKEIDEIISEKR